MKSTAILRRKSAAVGRFGENAACRHLEANGLIILGRNWKTKAGELDIIALDGETIVFAEVKTRRFKPGFPPMINLSYRQRKRNFNAAKLYLKTFDITGRLSRFDLIEVTIHSAFTMPEIRIHHGYLPDLPPLELPAAEPPEPVTTRLTDRLLFNNCFNCYAPNPQHTPFCPSCMEKLYFFDARYRCNGCGGENHGLLEFCDRCLAEEKRPWQQALALFAYRGLGRELIHRFKFRNHPELARPLGRMAADLMSSAGMTADLLVPVPLNPLRYLFRSYNQAALLAGVISGRTGIPVAGLLRRKFSLRKQSTLGRKARHRGLQNAFYTVKNPDITGKHIILIDDVLTTGATLTAAAEKLLDAGAGKVSVVVIGRTIAKTSGALKPVR
ncbi:MAG: hypothetical protein E7053_02305 [Lentisphaerae bacterium]|nr:hypothetical protein [Lentisphaerota bacterium]